MNDVKPVTWFGRTLQNLLARTAKTTNRNPPWRFFHISFAGSKFNFLTAEAFATIRFVIPAQHSVRLQVGPKTTQFPGQISCTKQSLARSATTQKLVQSLFSVICVCDVWRQWLSQTIVYFCSLLGKVVPDILRMHTTPTKRGRQLEWNLCAAKGLCAIWEIRVS